MVCEPLNEPLNGILLGDDVSVGSVMTVSCSAGFMFADRNLTQDLECLSVGSPMPVAEWSDDVRDCQRQYRSYNIIRKPNVK